MTDRTERRSVHITRYVRVLSPQVQTQTSKLGLTYAACTLSTASFMKMTAVYSRHSVFQYLVINSVYNKEFLCITHTVEHNYISPSSTVGIQLHVSALYVGHLQVVL